MPDGQVNARLCSAASARRPSCGGSEVSCILNAGLKGKTAEALAASVSSSASQCLRTLSLSLRLWPCVNGEPSALNPQYSGKNISPSSSLIFRTSIGAAPSRIIAPTASLSRRRIMLSSMWSSGKYLRWAGHSMAPSAAIWLSLSSLASTALVTSSASIEMLHNEAGIGCLILNASC